MMTKPKKNTSKSATDKMTTISDLVIDNSIGPSMLQRDEHGLLKNIQYSFNPDGSVNWREMIREEHLFPNRSWFESRSKEIPTSIDGLKDHQLLIKLSGIKELAKLRGFSSVAYHSEKCEHNHVAINCTMQFIGNYETGGEQVTFQDMANATLENTSSFATKFLETIACNRAFVRCVRNFLNVHIVGDDEIDKSNKPVQISEISTGSLTPAEILKSQCAQKLNCSTFEEFKNKLREFWESELYQNKEAANWSSFDDIPAKESRILLKIIKSI